MVPGMTERDGLAADVQRIAWLADAVLGPTRTNPHFTSATKSSENELVFPLGIWRRRLAGAILRGTRVQLNQPRAKLGSAEGLG